MSTKQILVLIVVALSVAGFFLLDLQAYLTFDYFQAQRESIVGAYEAHPIETAAIFFGIYVLVTGLSLPFAAVMTIVGGAIFGLVVGVLIISFASTIGATIAFLVSRTLLREWVQRRFAPQLKAINEGIERDGSFYLFSIRMVPLFPFVIVNLAMALTPMSTASFYVSSQLGMLAGTIVYVFAGTQVAQVHAAADLVSPGLLTAFAVLGLFPLVARKFTAEFFRRRRLRGHRRPPRFDNNVVVIGAGSAGLIASLIAATVKAKVTLIERDKMGGDCLNTGCVPSKTLLRSARVANTVREAVRYGIGAGPPHVDFPAVMERVRGVIRRIEPVDSVERYTGLGVECIAGEARVVDPWTVEVNGRRITTRAMILAAGAGPAVPPIPGLEDVGYLTSDTVWGLQSLPRRLLVMGAGPIGCELAQGFRRLGADVTLVDMMDRILPREDPEVSSLVAECFEREGIRVCTGHRATAFHAGEEGHVLEAEHGDERREFAFDRVLVAVGRRASLDGLGLEALDVERRPDGSVSVDPYMATSVPTIYACGDVTGPYQFTHMASHQAWFAAVNALFGGLWRFRVDYSVVPWITYTDPEVARVGLSEVEASDQGVAFDVTRFPLVESDRALADGQETGFVKVLTVRGTDRIVGATIVGAHAGEMLPEFVLAMTHGLGLKKIMGTIHVYPTLSEANKGAANAWRRANAPERLLSFVSRFHAVMRGRAA
ncbi:MAG: FAD-dependent oxidoreductase [Gammaproteobacteria bacterium]|jgi:dihydrolipoamide dehydrogenase